MRVFGFDDVPSEPWRNGRGVTRTLASDGGADSTPDAWRWRVSLADITADGAFSCFPGVDRISLLVDGGELALSEVSGPLRLRLARHQSAAYPGEAALAAHISAGPLRCLNVMTQRGAATAQLRRVSQATTLHGPCVAVVLQGAFRITSETDEFIPNWPVAPVLYAQGAINLIANPVQPGSLMALIDIHIGSANDA